MRGWNGSTALVHGVSARDDEGTELPGRQTAQREAIARAGRIIAEDASP